MAHDRQERALGAVGLLGRLSRQPGLIPGAEERVGVALHDHPQSDIGHGRSQDRQFPIFPSPLRRVRLEADEPPEIGSGENRHHGQRFDPPGFQQGALRFGEGVDWSGDSPSAGKRMLPALADVRREGGITAGGITASGLVSAGIPSGETNQSGPVRFRIGVMAEKIRAIHGGRPAERLQNLRPVGFLHFRGQER